jgi:hypothetical protein
MSAKHRPAATIARARPGSVLVACPTYAGKGVALARWAAAVHALDYAPVSSYQVDNTRGTTAYAARVRAHGIACDHIEPSADWEPTFRRSWQAIHRRAVLGGHRWILSLEADVIPGPDALRTLVAAALATGSEAVAAEVPIRPGVVAALNIAPDAALTQLGCSLFTPRLVGAALRLWPESGVMVAALWDATRRAQGRETRVTVPVEHIDDMDAEWWQYSDPRDPEQPCFPPAAVWTLPALRATLQETKP